MAEKLNDLTGKEWLKNSFSIWRDIRKTKEEKGLGHPASFPQELTTRIISIFTRENMKVLDPFAGSGTTLLSALELQRIPYGIELTDKFYDMANQRIKDEYENKRYHLFKDDCRNLEKHIEKESIDLCVTSPPYWDILNQKRTSDKKKTVNYSDLENDIGNIENYDEFLNELKNIFHKVYDVLKPGGYCIVNVMDLRKKSNFYPLHSDLADVMKQIGYRFDDIIIWDRQGDYNNAKPLGYPYKYRINKVHEYILIFYKEG